jgi:hypothetical protein
MATKLICDGCGRDIPKWQPGSGVKLGEGDGLTRKALLKLGNNEVPWDLCAACFERAANALAEVLPHTPRAEWNRALGLEPWPKG